MNEVVRNLTEEVLSDDWYTLKKYTYEIRDRHGNWLRQSREAYDRGNGATILLYDQNRQTVVLTRQFRLPTYLNGNSSGMLTETRAGLLDKLSPEACIRKELMEETGYAIDDVQRIMSAYMSPGSVTEILHFFIGRYTLDNRTGRGGGLSEEQEEIEILEYPLDKAFGMVASGEIRDAKTIMLLQYLQLNRTTLFKQNNP